MLFAKIYEHEKEKETILYLKKDKKYYLSGFSIDENGYSNVSTSLFNNIFKLFIKNENYKYLGNVRNYDVYLDLENDVKHFYKNDKENYDLFFEINNKPLILYNDSNDTIPETDEYYIRFKNYVLTVSKDAINNLKKIAPSAVYDFIISKIEDIKLETEEMFYLDKFKLDSINDFYEVIRNNKNLSEETKNYLISNNFIKDVFDYLLTEQKYSILYKLYTLKIVDKDLSEYNKKRNSNYLAVYNIPGNLIMGPETRITEYLGHEFAHLFQPSNNIGQKITKKNKTYYSYIMEVVADIVQNEYFNIKTNGYPKHCYNIKQLMDIIGPRPVWEYSFTGNANNLINILNEYLSREELKEYLTILKLLPENIKDEHHNRLEGLNHIIYKRKYGTDIKDDRNIYITPNLYIDDKVYFNEEKMKDYTSFNTFDAYHKGLLSNDKVGYIAKVNEKLKQEIEKNYKINEDFKIWNELFVPTEEVEEYTSYMYDCKIKLKGKEEERISIEKALEKGYIEPGYALVLNKEILEKYNLVSVIDEVPWGKMYPIVDGIIMDEDYELCSYKVVPINEIHPNQSIRNIEKKSIKK